jgi:hypothetical protein
LERDGVTRKQSKTGKLHSNAALTEEELAALKEVFDRPMQRAISDEHRDRLIAAGYIREARRRTGSVYALVPTGRGLRILKHMFTDRDLYNEQSKALPKKDVRSAKHR